MGRNKNSKTLKKDDFSVTADEDICYFTENVKPSGDRVSLFSFDDSTTQNKQEKELNIAVLNTNQINDTSNQNPAIQNSNESNTTIKAKDNLTIENNLNIALSEVKYSTLPKSSKKLLDGILTKVNFGSLPTIDGEPANVKRSYGLRHSTVVKIDAIKNVHSKTCVSVSTVVDMAIAYYYDCIFKNK